MRKMLFSGLLLLGLLVAISTLAFGQSEEYRLNLHRNFGYSSGTQVKGSFSVDVVPLTNVKAVTYQIDGQVMARVETSPFSYSFQTSSYPYGWHELNAVVETVDGRKVTTVTRRFEFATPDQESAGVVNVIFPILGILLVVTVVVVGGQYFFFRKRPNLQLELGAPRNYGVSGGGVCPRCHRPFALHWMAINVGLGTKFDRCDFCGKWGFVRRLSKAELLTAEKNELQMAKPATPIASKTEDDRMREMVDDSRYTS